jgi:tRNA threonylcarbamoyladenosine biosynthesis protein TsaB
LEKQNILIIDTSTSDLKIALSINGNEAFIDEKNNFKHIERLIEKIADCFKTTGGKKNDLEFAGICNGPGSFTGIRIGIASVLGISYSMKIRSFGFSVFDIYKFLLRDQKDSVIIPVIDAKKNKFYCSIITSEGNYQMLDISFEELYSRLKSFPGKIIFTGKDFRLIRGRIDFKHEYLYENDYSSEQMLSYAKFVLTNGTELSPPEPIYLRKSEAEIALLKKYTENSL